MTTQTTGDFTQAGQGAAPSRRRYKPGATSHMTVGGDRDGRITAERRNNGSRALGGTSGGMPETRRPPTNGNGIPPGRTLGGGRNDRHMGQDVGIPCGKQKLSSPKLGKPRATPRAQKRASPCLATTIEYIGAATWERTPSELKEGNVTMPEFWKSVRGRQRATWTSLGADERYRYMTIIVTIIRHE